MPASVSFPPVGPPHGEQHMGLPCGPCPGGYELGYRPTNRDLPFRAGCNAALEPAAADVQPPTSLRRPQARSIGPTRIPIHDHSASFHHPVTIIVSWFGCRERLAHFLWLVTRCRSWRETLLFAAARSAAGACLHWPCRRSGGAEETEPHDAWRGRGGPLRHARTAPRASACGRSLC